MILKRPEGQPPEFEDHTFENILQWGEAKVIFEDKFVHIDENGNEVVESIPEFACWILSWKHGTISFTTLNNIEQEVKARKAAAMFIYLWMKPVPANIAAHLAEAYVLVFEIRKIQ